MKKLSKTAQVLDKIVVIFMIVILVVMSILTLAIGVMAFVSGDMPVLAGPQGTGTSLQLGNLRFTLAPGYGYDLNIPVGYYIAVIASLLLYMAFLIVAVKVLRNILAPMKEGRPFDEKVGRGLTTMGWMWLVRSVLGIALRTSMSAFLFKLLDTEKLFLGSNVTECRFNIQPDLTGAIIGAAAFFLLGFIFKYGASLQQQADETL